MNNNRLRILQNGIKKKGVIIYWMQRDQRVNDNWALIYAYTKAKETNNKLVVIFNLVPEFLEATIRQYGFMIKGLKEVEENLANLNISFILTLGNPANEIPKQIENLDASLLVTDFNPLKISRIWKRDVSKKIQIPFHEVDAHNIVPTLYVSDKLEYAAYTIRPKIKKLLYVFLDDFPILESFSKSNLVSKENVNWEKAEKSLKINFEVKEVTWLLPGEKAALDTMNLFFSEKLKDYNENRNDPNNDALSNISPYLHFGQISAQRIALEAKKYEMDFQESVNSYLEEMIVRRELSDNFCYFNPKYDLFEGFHEWAQLSLNVHRKDKRDFIYSLEEFETAKTHDDLWNAAQLQMVNNGKMHGYMRMYWAKKILEWTETPEQALEFAIFLNDKYELDGRDPNGYAGVAWSIGGVHDRAWSERAVFGKIRYMNYNGCKRKFNIQAYIQKNFNNSILF